MSYYVYRKWTPCATYFAAYLVANVYYIYDWYFFFNVLLAIFIGTYITIAGMGKTFEKICIDTYFKFYLTFKYNYDYLLQ